MLSLDVFTDLFSAGLTPIPLKWNTDSRDAEVYPHHGKIDPANYGIRDVESWMREMRNANGVALKLYPPFGSIDMDLKNTPNKNVFNEWLEIIRAVNEDVLRKVCIEKTRNEGYHIYIKYAKLTEKIPVAKHDGKEVISVYTGSLLMFCFPTPGYQIIHNDFNDLDFLTDDEFELLLTTAARFNDDSDFRPGDKSVQLERYPIEYESTLLQFDQYCTDEVFETLLNSIGLFRVAKDSKLYNRKNLKYVPFLREGSLSEYSAKAYFKSKRLLIFSASMKGFPTWHDSTGAGDTRWVLTPSKIVYYKNSRSWPDTLDEIQMISDSAGLNVIESTPVTKQPLMADERMKFPYDVFPQPIQDFIFSQVIQHEYLAGAVLVALSTAIGNSVVLEAMDGYHVKPILYMAIVAPPGASKSPALKKAFKPLEDYDDRLYQQYGLQLEEFKNNLARYEKDKKHMEKPEKPPFPQTLIKDSTIEMVVKILSHNKKGCCVLADELSGFLARMNQYKTGDEVQKWLEMWSGSPILLQRITRDENKVQDPYCNVVGGIQPGVLESLSKAENEHNGFYHRFLFVYPVPKEKEGWQRIRVSDSVKRGFHELFEEVLARRNDDPIKYRLSEPANLMYEQWFNHKNAKYNRATTDHVKGIISKYQDYCLRLALLLQVIQDASTRTGQVSESSMERAIRLTEYFLGNMHKATKLLAPETPVDKLSEVHKKLYDQLPTAFTAKSAIQIGERLGLKESAVKMFLNRAAKTVFTVIERGKYEKMF
jgi:hypothetical protein